MRVRPLVFASLLFLTALGSASAALKSNSVAVTLVARVAPVLELQAGEPAATGGSAHMVSSGQNEFAVVFTPAGMNTASVEIPVLIKANVNDVLFRAACDCVSGTYISLKNTAATGNLFVSRPMPLGQDVAFALASGLIRNPAMPVGTPLPGVIGIVVPPGLPEGQPITIKITIEALRR